MRLLTAIVLVAFLAGLVAILRHAALAPVLVLGVLALYLRTRLPSESSFGAFFRDWYTQEYFPQVSDKISSELRGKNGRGKQAKGRLEGLAEFSGWLMDQTHGLCASAWYDLVVSQVLPADFEDLFFMRTATVDIGSSGRPCPVTFWGVCNSWMLAPTISLDVSNVSIVHDVSTEEGSSMMDFPGMNVVGFTWASERN